MRVCACVPVRLCVHVCACVYVFVFVCLNMCVLPLQHGPNVKQGQALLHTLGERDVCACEYALVSVVFFRSIVYRGHTPVTLRTITPLSVCAVTFFSSIVDSRHAKTASCRIPGTRGGVGGWGGGGKCMCVCQCENVNYLCVPILPQQNIASCVRACVRKCVSAICVCV